MDRILKTITKFTVYLLLPLFTTSCMDMVVISSEQPFVISSITRLERGLFKYENESQNCTGLTVDYIISNVRFKIGDTLMLEEVVNKNKPPNLNTDFRTFKINEENEVDYRK